MMAIQSMVTRKDFQGRVWGARQRISLSEAMRIRTMQGAYASFEEGTKGSSTPGKLADIVILEKDRHMNRPDRIVGIDVLRIILGGRTTCEAQAIMFGYRKNQEADRTPGASDPAAP